MKKNKVNQTKASKKVKEKKKGSYATDLLARLKKKKSDEQYFFFDYHSRPFHYFHRLMDESGITHRNYRAEYWSKIDNGIYHYDQAQAEISKYKQFLDQEIKLILEKYSISFWMHVSRRIAPESSGEDHRPETIRICRNIIVAAIQKHGRLQPCSNLKPLSEVKHNEIFNGLLLKQEFANDLSIIKNMSDQLVLTNFDETTLYQYYAVEKLAYEMWFSNAKSRVLAKGASLIVDKNSSKILEDDRSAELDWLLDNFDSRVNKLTATSTGTVFEQPDSKNGLVLITQLLAERTKPFNNTVSAKLFNIQMIDGGNPNFEFVVLNIRSYLQTHLEFADDFKSKWNVELEYVVAVIADISISLMYDLFKAERTGETGTVFNALFRSYRLYNIEEYTKGLRMNWQLTIEHLKINLNYDETKIKAAIQFLTLSESNKKEIYVDTYGPLKIFLPAVNEKSIFIDHSLLGDVLYNLFAGLPLIDRGFKGELLERALKNTSSYLPTTESKASDGSSKQVDFSIAVDDILILVECKAVARSFGIFSGQTKAIQHRLRNVIEKGLNDVDDKINWFVKHPVGTNYDVRKFKFLVGIAVSPFPEFTPSKDKKFWLNDTIPRTLTIGEFEQLLELDIAKLLKYNLISIKG